MFDNILDRKKPSKTIKTESKKKSINLDFSKVISPWFLVKNWKFSHVCILGYRENMPGNVFTIF